LNSIIKQCDSLKKLLISTDKDRVASFVAPNVAGYLCFNISFYVTFVNTEFRRIVNNSLVYRGGFQVVKHSIRNVEVIAELVIIAVLRFDTSSHTSHIIFDVLIKNIKSS